MLRSSPTLFPAAYVREFQCLPQGATTPFGAFPKWWYPQIHIFMGCSIIKHYKTSILGALGYHHFRKASNGDVHSTYRLTEVTSSASFSILKTGLFHAQLWIALVRIQHSRQCLDRTEPTNFQRIKHLGSKDRRLF